MYLKKKNSLVIIVPFIIVILLSAIFVLKTPALKSNLEQELRTALNEKFLYLPENSLVSNIENIYLSFFKNTKKYPLLKIEIPFKEFNIIKSDREKALRYGVLENANEVRGSINFNGENFSANFRLKGNLPDHWNNTKQWSFKVSLNEGESVLGFTEFSMVQHRTREYPYSEIVTKNLERMGLRAPVYKTAKINLNGQNWGLMQIEESFSNSFLEKRQLKKKPIYKLTNEDDLLLGWKYYENGLKGLKNHSITEDQLKNLSKWLGKFEVKTLNLKSNYSQTNFDKKDSLYLSLLKDQKLVETILYKANSNQIKNYKDVRRSFNIQAMSDAMVSSIVWGEQHYHSLEPHNSRYYLNPFTKLIEIFPNDHAHTFILDVDMTNIINQINRMPNFYRILFFNNNIHENIKLSINKFKKNLINIETDFNIICDYDKIACKKKIKTACKGYDFGRCKEVYYLDELKKNLSFIEKNYSKIFTEKNLKNILQETKIDLDENWVAEELVHKIYLKSDLEKIKIINLIPYEIYINNILSFDNNGNLIEKKSINKILNRTNFNSINELEIKMDQIGKKQIFKFEVNFHIKNSDIKLNQVFFNNNYEAINEKKLFSLNPILNLKKDTFFIKRGKHLVLKPIIIPKGYDLIINEGTELLFKNSSYILIKDGSIKLNGTKQNPIFLSSNNNEHKNFWNGIYVKSKDLSKSIIKYTFIKDLNFFTNRNFFLTGGINFYNVDLEMKNVFFENCISEDCLNITKSIVNISDLNFKNAASDGLDLDFVQGNLKNFKAKNIKGDGIDISGSSLKIENIDISNIGDKCISIGENSFTELDNIILENCKFGLVVKDSGKSKIKNIKITDISKYDVATYRKKRFFDGELVVKINNIKSNNKYFSQINTLLEVNNEKIISSNYSTKIINDIF